MYHHGILSANIIIKFNNTVMLICPYLKKKKSNFTCCLIYLILQNLVFLHSSKKDLFPPSIT